MANLGSFDADTMDGYDTEVVEEPTAASVTAVVNELEDTSVNEIDDSMNEVEKRLEIASYYRLLLEDNLFNDDSEAAARVNNEVRGFVRRRLEVLVGLRAEKTEAVSQFSKEEVVALKAVAAKVMKVPAIVVPKAPEIKKVAPPPPAAIHKFEAKRKPGRPPKAREVISQVKAAPQPKQPDGIRVGDIVNSKGEVVKKNAKFKRIVAPDGSEHDLEVTEPARATGGVPPLSNAQLQMVMESQAQQQVASFSPAAAVAATAVITAAEQESERQ